MDELFDVEKPAHVAARARLDTELIAWLVTTTADGRPHPVPVWFLSHDGVISIVSEPDTIKMKHLRRGSKATLHFDAGRFGDDVVVLHGDARVTPDAGPELSSGSGSRTWRSTPTRSRPTACQWRRSARSSPR